MSEEAINRLKERSQNVETVHALSRLLDLKNAEIKQLKATIDAMNAQNSEPVYYEYRHASGNQWNKCTELVYRSQENNPDYVQRKLYLTPQPLSLEMAEYVADVEAKALAVIDRWESPNWKDLPHTATFIHALRDAIAAKPKAQNDTHHTNTK